MYIYILQIITSKKQRNNKNSEHENIYVINTCVSRKILKARLCLQSCLQSFILQFATLKVRVMSVSKTTAFCIFRSTSVPFFFTIWLLHLIAWKLLSQYLIAFYLSFLLSVVDPWAAHLKYVDLFAFVVDDGSIHSIGSHLLMLCINRHIPICLNATWLLQGFIIIIIIFIIFISVHTAFHWFACAFLWHWYWATLGLLILWERIWFFTSDVPQLVILVFSFVFLLVLPCLYPCLLLSYPRTGYEGKIRHNFFIQAHSVKWVPPVEAVSKLEVSTIWK